MAQDISGTNLATNAAKAVRKVAYKVEVQWDGLNWTDETTRLKRGEWDNALAPPDESVAEPGAGYAHEATVVLHNESGRYSPYNPSSPIAVYIEEGKYYLTPIRLYAGFENELLRIFTGYLVNVQNPALSGETILTVRDRSATIIQEKATTAVYTGVRTDEWLGVLCDLVGISAGDRQFDTGTMIIPYAWLDDESVWEQMALAAAAEGGFLYFGWDGKLRFENGAHWAQHSASEFTFDRNDMADLDPAHRAAEVYNEVVVEYSPRTIGPVQEVFTLDKPVVIGPGGSYPLEARLQHPALPIYTPLASTDYVAVLATGDRSDGTLSVQNEVKWAQRYEADLVNTSTSHTLIVTKFRLMGNPLLGDPSGQVKVTRSSTVAYARTKEIRNNPLVQTAAQATMLAEFLADRWKNPRLILPVKAAPAVPWLELGDRITIQEPRLFTGAYANRDAFITQITGRFGPAEPFSMDITGISVAGMLQTNAYFRWSLIVPTGTCTVKVNGVTVVTASSTSAGVADLNSLGLTGGEFYTVTVETTADNTYVVELAEQADATASPTAPTFPTFNDAATSAASDLNAVRDGVAWLYARARNPVLPHVGRYGTNRPSSWTEDEFPDNYRLVWRGTVRHRHNMLKGRLQYFPSSAVNNGEVQVRVRVDGGDAGEHFVTKTAGQVYNGNVDDFTLALSGLSVLNLTPVEVYARHEKAGGFEQGDDGSSFGPLWLYEDSGNAKIAGWTALPSFAHLDKPTAANLNKLKADGDLLAAVARYANRPTPLLTDATLTAHAVHIRHTWRWLKYQTRYAVRDGEAEPESVKLSWGENEVTLADTAEGGWGAYDLDSIAWLPLGAIYRIENAVYVLETPTA